MFPNRNGIPENVVVHRGEVVATWRRGGGVSPLTALDPSVVEEAVALAGQW